MRAAGWRLDEASLSALTQVEGGRKPRLVCAPEHLGLHLLVTVRPRAAAALGDDPRPLVGLTARPVFGSAMAEAETASLAAKEAEDEREAVAAFASFSMSLSGKAEEYARVMEGRTKLDLRKKKIGGSDMFGLCEALKMNRTLTDLDLSFNDIGSAAF